MKLDVNELIAMSKRVRKDIVNMIHESGDGHPGPSMSSVDIVTALYFSVMKIDSKNPKWEDRDRFVLSKGHACPMLYAVLAQRGYFSTDILKTLRKIDSKLQGHPDMNKTPGVDSTSGSLGNGVSVGFGMAIAAKLKKKDYFTYVVTGDGELEEGIVWEAMMSAKHYNMGNLIVFIDNNGKQSGGSTTEISGLDPIFPKWQAFGWHCQEIDGHNFEEILTAIDEAKKETNKPSLIMAHTIKGKGVPYMENDNSWHKRVPTKEEVELAMIALSK